MDTSQFATAVEDLSARQERGEAIHPGDLVGAFRIESELGRGGMGVVYRAEQVQPVRRKVALKLMLQKLKGSVAETLFEIERQALADMNHPGIAKIFDAGRTAHGFSWLAMEWIDGPTLYDHLKQHTLSRDELLRIFVRLCFGVQHAHERGLVHRDLKLANVLIARVDGIAQPKLIDFGLAVTLAGASAPLVRGGTLSYMSPEQRDQTKRIDARSDVYSLGIILLRMLTPMAVQGELESLGSSGELSGLFHNGDRAPERSAPAWMHRIDPELRQVIALALRHDPTQRYDTARALAEDVERFRACKPLRAVSTRRLYRASKFLRRHALAVLLAGLAVSGLVLATVGSTLGYWRAEQARERAEIEAGKAREIASFVESLINGLDPAVTRGMDSKLLRMLVDDAERRVETELKQQPEVLAEIYRILARTRSGLGEDKAAVLLGARALSLYQATGQQAVAQWRMQRAIGTYEVEAGQDAVGVRRLGTVVAELTRLLGAEHPDTLIARSALAWYSSSLSGQRERALSELRAIVPAMQRALAADDRDLWLAMHRLAIICGEQGQYQEAHAIYRQLERMMEAKLGADHPLLLSMLNSAAVLYSEQRNYPVAGQLLAELLPKVVRVFGEQHAMTLSVTVNLAGALRQAGKLTQSGPYYERAYQLAKSLYGDDHLRSHIASSNYGNYLTASGNPNQAEPLQRAALAGMIKAFGAEHMYAAEMQRGLAETLIALGQLKEAETLLSGAEATILKQAPDSRSDLEKIAETKRKLATARSTTGRD